MSVLAYPRKAVSLIILWAILLTVAWFAAPSLTRYGLRLAAVLPHRAVSVQLTDEERTVLINETVDLHRTIFRKKQKGNTDLRPEYLELGIRYEKLGAYTYALEYLTRVTNKEPMNARAWMHQARVLEGLTLYQDASDAWRQAIEHDTKNASHYARLAALLDRWLNDTFRANGVYLEGLVRSGNPPELMRSYALFLERIGERSTALLYWKALLEKDPTNTALQDRVRGLEH